MTEEKLQEQYNIIQKEISEIYYDIIKKNQNIRSIYIIGLIISSICFFYLTYNYFIPNTFYIWVFILLLTLLLSFVISKKYKPFSKLNDEIKASIIKLLRHHQNINDFLLRLKEVLEKNHGKLTQDLKIKYIIDRFLEGMIQFQKFFNINFTLDRKNLTAPLSEDFNHNKINYMEELSKYIKIPEKILNLTYNWSHNIIDDQIWKQVKKSDKNLNILIKFLRNSKKLTPQSKEFQDDILVKIVKTLMIFDIEDLNKNIKFLVKYNQEILNFNEFLRNNSIIFNEKFDIWNDLITIHKETIPGRLNFDDYLWEMEISTISLNHDFEFSQDIVVLLIFEFLIQNYSEKESIYCKKISKHTNVASLLHYFYKERYENEKIGDFFKDHSEKIKIYMEELENDKLNPIFLHELRKGNLIIDETILLSKFIQKKIHEDEYKEISQIIFNPSNPIDLSKALRKYFALKIKDINFLKSLGLAPRIKPFLLSFYSSKGAVSGYITQLLKKNEKFNLEMKYNAAQYTKSSRIGVLSNQFDSMEDFKLELERELTEIIKKDKQREELKKRFEEIDFFLKTRLEFKDNMDKFKKNFKLMLDLEFDKNELIEQMWTIVNLLPDNEREKIINDINDLERNLKDYPPSFQVIIHELTYDPKSIQMFGNMKKIAPFELLKNLFAEMIEKPEELVALLEFNQETKEISLQELNEKFIKSLTIQDIIISSTEMKKIHLNKSITDKLDNKGTQQVIKDINNECNNLLELSLYISGRLGFAKNNIMSQDEYIKFVETKSLKQKDLYAEIKQAFIKNLIDLSEDSKEIFEISSNFIKSMLYISMVVYNKIIKMPEISSLKLLSLDKYEEILEICFSLSNYMEEHVGSFSHLDEPKIRDYILGYLNTNYEGRASGETFHKEGKTDILLKFRDATKFVAECKLWKGPKYIKDAIEKQLMEKYTTWRDVETALLIFNKDTKQSTVNEKIDPLIKSIKPYYEKRFKFKSLKLQKEGVFGYEFHRKGDKKLKFKLAVLVFHIPR